MDHPENTDFELVEPFDVDNGELDGLSPSMCFTLGVEWETFRQKLKEARPFSTLVLDKNAARIVTMVERQKRFVEHHPHCEGWVVIAVGDYVV